MNRTTTLVALVLVGICLPTLGHATPLVLYDLDFDGPTHSVGSQPTTGAGPVPRDQPTSVSTSSGSSLSVVSSFGALADRPVEVDSNYAGSSFAHAYMVLDLDDAGIDDFDVYNLHLDLVFDDAGIGFVRFSPGMRIVFTTGGRIDAGFTPNVATYTTGTLQSLDIEIDRVANQWSVDLNGSTVFTGTPDTLALSDLVIGAPSSNSSPLLYADNILLTAVPEPGSGILCGLGLAGLGLRRCRWVARSVR